MHGFLAVYKPKGPSSAAVTNRIKRTVKGKFAIGHTGTLDPLAEGLLIVALGNATRFIRFLKPNKSYESVIQFGTATTSYDAEGEVTNTKEVPKDLKQKVLDALPSFTGQIDQVAPSYSALKFEGKPMYEYARNNIEVPQKTRQVLIDSINLLEVIDNDKVRLDIHTGPGVYIRSLAFDLGLAVKSCAHLASLKRTSCHQIQLEDSVSFEDLEDEQKINKALINAESLLEHMQTLSLDDIGTTRIKNGLTVASEANGIVMLYDTKGKFFGIGDCEQKVLKSVRLMPQPQPKLSS